MTYETRSTIKPWGAEIVLYQTPAWTVKILHINPGQRLSEQYHERKWECIYYPNGEVLSIPPNTVHRLENKTDVPIDLLEVSMSGLENDIVRIADDYGRVVPAHMRIPQAGILPHNEGATL